jgi:hypothetical protein
MKKLMSAAVLVLATAAAVFAAGTPETVTVEGKLAVTESVPNITSGGKTYLFPAGAFYQLAFENGIKTGDTIKAEGFVMDFPPDADAPRAAGNGPAVGKAPAAGTAPTADNAPGAGRGMMARNLPDSLKDAKMFIPSKVWVNGKEIDLSKVRFGGMMMGDGGRGGMRGDDDGRDCRGTNGGMGFSGNRR